MTHNDRIYHLALREIHQAAGATFARHWPPPAG